jgi:ribosomal protein S18 acetylase RimI-like enzyme
VAIGGNEWHIEVRDVLLDHRFVGIMNAEAGSAVVGEFGQGDKDSGVMGTGSSTASGGVAILELTRAVVPLVVDIHLEAFDGYMNASLGRGYARAFLSWFCEAQDGISLIARLDGEIVGYVVGAPVGYNARLTRDLAWVVIRALGWRPWLALRKDIRRALGGRLRMLKSVGGPALDGNSMGETVGRTVSLVGIGVADAARGHGAGGALLRAFESEARTRNMEAMRLTVYRDNSVACRVYERAGWQSSDDGGDTLRYSKPIVGL